MINNEKILNEQFFRYVGMSYDEMEFYLNSVIYNCNEICNTINPVDGLNICNVVEIIFRKEGNLINFNGSLNIGHENRCIDGIIKEDKESIIVDMNIIRLCVESEIKEYSTCDVFKVINNKLVRNSTYSCDKKDIEQNLVDGKLKGKIL